MGLEYGALLGGVALVASFALPLIWIVIADRAARPAPNTGR
jgi:hypothetical protein